MDSTRHEYGEFIRYRELMLSPTTNPVWICAEVPGQPHRARSMRITLPQSSIAGRPSKEHDVRRSEETLGDCLTSSLNGPAMPRRHTANPTVGTSPRRHTSKASAFSCRRWRKLTGKVSEPSGKECDSVVAVMAHPPPHWSSSPRVTDGLVSAFPTSTLVTPSRGRSGQIPPPGGKGARWQEIDRFDGGIMKKLVDKAYGITASHHIAQQFPLHHGSRAAQRQFIHSQVYLPSVHRTLDYIEKRREFVGAPPRARGGDGLASELTPTPARRPPRPPPPLGSKLLSVQLHALQAELLAHYDAEKIHDTPGQMWSPCVPHPPRAYNPLPPTSSVDSLRSSRSGSFRSQRHLTAKPTRETIEPEAGHRSDAGEEAANGGVTDDDEEHDSVLVLTDSDTYSLSSGAEADSEMEQSTPPLEIPILSSSSSGSASWPSLESHVLQALDGSDAAQIGSVHEPLVVVSDSDDLLAILSDTSSEPSVNVPSTFESTTLLAGIADSAIVLVPFDMQSGEERHDEDACEHVVFVDNGVIVNAAGQVVTQENEVVDAWAIRRVESGDISVELTHCIASADPTLEDESVEACEAEPSDINLLENTCQEEPQVLAQEKRTCSRSDSNRDGDHSFVEDAGQTTDEEPLIQQNRLEDCVSEVDRVAPDIDIDQPSSPKASTETMASMVSSVLTGENGSVGRDLVHRDSISSTATYNDADFEDSDVNDAGSVQGYESFED